MKPTRIRLDHSAVSHMAASLYQLRTQAERMTSRWPAQLYELERALVDIAEQMGTKGDTGIDLTIGEPDGDLVTYTFTEAAERIGVKSPKTIGRWVKSGELDAVTLGGRPRIPSRALREKIAERNDS